MNEEKFTKTESFISVYFQVRSIGMDSEELLKLVETCPSGAETLITRILHIITEKGIFTIYFLLKTVQIKLAIYTVLWRGFNKSWGIDVPARLYP